MALKLIACFTATVLVLAGPMFAPGAYAVQADCGHVVSTAVSNLEIDYPEKLNYATLVNAALDGLRQKINSSGGNKFIVLPPYSGENNQPLAYFYAKELFARKAFGGRFNRCDLEFAAAAAMLKSLHDSHTAFLYPDKFQADLAQESGTAIFSGIGIDFKYFAGNGAYILDVFPGPAERAGLKRFDKILAVNGVAVKRLYGKNATDSAKNIGNVIRGQDGTSVTVTVKRPGIKQPLTFTMLRQPIVAPAVMGKMLNDKVGYINLYGFDDNSAEAFADAVRHLRQHGMQSLILDLRDDEGGFVKELKQIASFLLPNNLLISHSESRFGEPEDLFTESVYSDYLNLTKIPLVILVNGGSASSSEILASAVQTYHRGVIIGERTCGCLEYSVMEHLPDGAGMNTTIARVTVPAGNGAFKRIEGSGIVPDINVKMGISDVERGMDVQLFKALEYFSGQKR